MCVSFGRAEFEGTRILVANKNHPDSGQPVQFHLYDVNASKPKPKDRSMYGYSGGLSHSSYELDKLLNRVLPNREKPQENQEASGRAISLNIPSVKPLSPENFVTIPEKDKDVLKVVDRVWRTGIPFEDVMLGTTRGGFGRVQVFEHGIFTIASAKNPTDILEAMAIIPENKRAFINPELLEFYERGYPDNSFAMAFWDSNQADARIQLAYYFQSLEPDNYFFPAVDNQDNSGVHTGGAPVDKPVDRNHYLYWGSDEDYPNEAGVDMSILFDGRFVSSEFARWLPRTIFGTRAYLSGKTENGDIHMLKNDPRMFEPNGPFSGVHDRTWRHDYEPEDYQKDKLATMLNISKPRHWT